MRTVTLVLVASLLAFGSMAAPASADPGGSDGGTEVCVPGLTLCCTISGEAISDDGAEVPTDIRCL